MINRATFVFTFSIFLAFTQLTFAQSEDVSSTLEVYKITTNQQGEETAEEVTTITRGDTLEYQVTYTNNLPNSISNLQPVLPIPTGIEYMANTAEPEINTASLSPSGSNFQQLPIMREETTESGLATENEVPAREYRRLRWSVPSLDSQNSVTVTARVQVIQANI
jgi:uncharacterized repeat protein (TIGR01451 family)